MSDASFYTPEQLAFFRECGKKSKGIKKKITEKDRIRRIEQMDGVNALRRERFAAKQALLGRVV